MNRAVVGLREQWLKDLEAVKKLPVSDPAHSSHTCGKGVPA